MRNLKFALGLFCCLVAQINAAEIGSIKCLGGDGPNPLTDITKIQNMGVNVFDVKGTVHEFIFWERKNQIVYRNQLGKIFRLDLKSGKSFLLGSSSVSLSKVKDPDERYVTLAGSPIALDTGTNPPRWQKWSLKKRVKHLYWHRFFGRDSLFSVTSSIVRPQQQQIEVYSFGQKGVKPHICNLYSSVGEVFHLGEGHSYPNVFLYRVKKENQCTRLTYFNIQIEGELAGLPVCKLYQSGQYSTLIPGNVKEVYQFPELMTGNQNMFVVRTDHPEKNLLWDDGIYGCRFYNFGQRIPMVLNPRQTTLAVWSEEEGLSLIYPRTFENGEPVILHPLRDQIIGPVHQHHLALSSDGKTLLVLAKLKGSYESENRQLIKVTLQ
jgi:hypothetical protein